MDDKEKYLLMQYTQKLYIQCSVTMKIFVDIQSIFLFSCQFFPPVKISSGFVTVVKQLCPQMPTNTLLINAAKAA